MGGFLYLLAHKHTHGAKRAEPASPELDANRLHQSAWCVRDCGDDETEQMLSRSNIQLHLCHAVAGPRLARKRTNKLSTPGLSQCTKLRVDNK